MKRIASVIGLAPENRDEYEAYHAAVWPEVLQTITANVSSDYTPNMAIYAASTLGGDTNLGSAMAVILGLATLIVSLVLVRFTNRTPKERV